ncbi:MAG: YbaN family protein [Oscillospiraceae bacterium]|nr:YbaN family protein [Oscillospiraceae bacterium]
MKRVLLNILGFAALACGAVGVALPVLPTTPFVLCAAGCFSAANPAMYRRLAKGKTFGEYIRNYRERTGISAAARVRGIVFLWVSLGISGALIRRPGVLIVLGIVGAAVTAHILTIRRKR